MGEGILGPIADSPLKCMEISQRSECQPDRTHVVKHEVNRSQSLDAQESICGHKWATGVLMVRPQGQESQPMQVYRWPECPVAVKAQVERYVDRLRGTLGADLVGVYLHGSLAMGCPAPLPKDVDLLVVVAGALPAATKRSVAETLVQESAQPCPLEVHFLRAGDVSPWQHPAPFEMHFGEGWRGWFTERLGCTLLEDWNRGIKADPDLAAHITIARSRGRVLYGPPASTVFPEVPRKDYVDSVLYDLASTRDELDPDPVYGVLNLCRTYWYLLEERLPSKLEAGLWARGYLPDPYRLTVARALESYSRNERGDTIDPSELRQFLSYMDTKMKPLLHLE